GTSPTASPTWSPAPATPPSASCGSCPPNSSDRIRRPAAASLDNGILPNDRTILSSSSAGRETSQCLVRRVIVIGVDAQKAVHGGEGIAVGLKALHDEL